MIFDSSFDCWCRTEENGSAQIDERKKVQVVVESFLIANE